MSRSISRRAFTAGALSLWLAPWRARADGPVLVDAEGGLVPDAGAVIAASEYAYVNPRLADGAPSTCHGEVWFAWLDGAVYTTTSRKSWKARAVARGLDRARIWFGSHGRWRSRLGGRNEAFRSGPSLAARASVVGDVAVLDRILAVYEKKYPAEIGDWSARMHREVAAGERVILRYAPVGG